MQKHVPPSLEWMGFYSCMEESGPYQYEVSASIIKKLR